MFWQLDGVLLRGVNDALCANFEGGFELREVRERRWTGLSHVQEAQLRRGFCFRLCASSPSV